jgi:hypothetical protein
MNNIPRTHPASGEYCSPPLGGLIISDKYSFITSSVFRKQEDDRIVGLQIETSAYALADRMPDKYSNPPNIPKGIKRRSSCNREQDIKWLKKKIAWLFEKAGVPLLPFEYEHHDSDTQPRKNAGPKNQVVDNV